MPFQADALVGGLILLALVATLVVAIQKSWSAQSPTTPTPVLDDEPDPLAEAEVNLGFGRAEHARKLLHEAVVRLPHRTDLQNALSRLESTGTLQAPTTEAPSDAPLGLDGLSPASQLQVRALVKHLRQLERAARGEVVPEVKA